MQTASRANQYLQTTCSQLAFSKKQQIRWTLLIETRCEVGRKFSNSTVCLMGRTAKWQSDASQIVAEEKQWEQLCSNRFYMVSHRKENLSAASSLSQHLRSVKQHGFGNKGCKQMQFRLNCLATRYAWRIKKEKEKERKQHLMKRTPCQLLGGNFLVWVCVTASCTGKISHIRKFVGQKISGSELRE